MCACTTWSGGHDVSLLSHIVQHHLALSVHGGQQTVVEYLMTGEYVMTPGQQNISFPPSLWQSQCDITYTIMASKKCV